LSGSFGVISRSCFRLFFNWFLLGRGDCGRGGRCGGFSDSELRLLRSLLLGRRGCGGRFRRFIGDAFEDSK